MKRLIFALLLAAASPAFAEGVVCGPCTATWNAPVVNADGGPLTDLASYNVYIATAAGGPFGKVASVLPAPAPSFAITLPAGQKYIAVTAVNAAGLESPQSNVVPFIFAYAPGAPTSLTIK